MVHISVITGNLYKSLGFQCHRQIANSLPGGYAISFTDQGLTGFQHSYAGRKPVILQKIQSLMACANELPFSLSHAAVHDTTQVSMLFLLRTEMYAM